MSFDERILRDALGLFPTGVAVATVRTEEVASLHAANAAKSPLLYFRSGYRRLAEAA